MTDVCNLCGKEASLMCQRCNETYCSTNCQILDWRVHKKVCIQMPSLVPIKEFSINDTNANRSFHDEAPRSRVSNDNHRTPKSLARNPLKVPSDFEDKISDKNPSKIRAEIDFSLKPKKTQNNFNDSARSNPSHVSKMDTHNAFWRLTYAYPTEGFFDCVVQYVDPDNAGIVWVTELRCEGSLRKLLAEINRNIDVNTERCNNDEIKVGSLIAAPYENLYYRAEIIDMIPERKTAVVILIDYGNTIEVPYNDLRSPIPIMQNLRTYSFRIRYTKPVAVESVITIRALGVEPNGIVKVEEKICISKIVAPGLTTELFATNPVASLVKYSKNGQYAFFCFKNQQVLEQLNEMNTFLNSNEVKTLKIDNPPQNKGDFIAARTAHGWSRALVMTNYKNNYLVYLIDMGRISLAEDISPVPDKYKNIPMQVFIIELRKVLSEGKNLIDCLPSNTDFIFKYQKGTTTNRKNSFPCCIQLTDGGKIAEVEAFNFYANFDEINCTPRDWVESLVFGSIVYITNVVSHCEVYISLASTKLYTKVFVAAAEDCDALSSNDCVVGAIVLAKAENEYFRAKVLGKANNDIILVLNIDTGCQLTVSTKNLRQPNTFLLSYPCNMIKVRLMYLSNVATPYVENKALAMLQQCQQNGAEFILKFDTNLEKGVELCLVNAEQPSLNKQLLPMLFEKKCDSPNNKPRDQFSAVQSDVCVNKCQTFTNCQDTQKIFTLEDLEIIPITCGDNVPIMVLDSSTISKGFISGCDFSNKEYLSQLELEYLPLVSKYCATLDPNGEYCPRVDEICLAIYDEDKSWYRAVCLDKMKDNTFYVMFLDYGNMCKVHKSNIRQITNELMFPSNANMCVFEGLPDPVPLSMCQKFISVIQGDPKIFANVTKLEQDSYLLKLPSIDKYF